MPCRAWFDRFPKVCLVLLTLGSTAGCYIPGGGWTLRTGVDWRTHAKPGAYLELVDTRWDEWNRVAQMNAMMESAVPVATEVHSVPAAPPPAAQPPVQEPYPIPPAAGVSGEMESPPRMETSLQGSRMSRPTGRLQVAERRSTRPPVMSEGKLLDSASEREPANERVAQSSWSPSEDVANRSAASKSSTGKAPPGGWLFRGVRR